MLTAAEILNTIEEEETYDVRQLAQRLEVRLEQLEKVLGHLCKHNLIEHDPTTGKVRLPTWLLRINMELENLKPATGVVILPKNEEIRIQDIAIGNLTRSDLELKIRLKTRLKEITICDMG